MIVAKIDRIKSLRLERGLNKKQLAEKAGLPSNAISRIEKGESKSIHQIRAKVIAEALGCPLEDIFAKK